MYYLCMYIYKYDTYINNVCNANGNRGIALITNGTLWSFLAKPNKNAPIIIKILKNE